MTRLAPSEASLRATSRPIPRPDPETIEGHDTGAAKPDIVLESEPQILDLTHFRRTAQLVSQFIALRQSGRAKRMSLRKKAAGRIGDVEAAICVLTVPDIGLGTAFGTQAKCFI